MLVAEARGEASALDKTHVGLGHGHGLHAVGGVLEGAGVAGTKTWAHTGVARRPLLVLFGHERWSAPRRHRGVRARAAPHQRDLGNRHGSTRTRPTRRCSRSSAPAAKRWRRRGGGRRTPIHEVRVFSLHDHSREALAERVEQELAVPAVATVALEDATASADVITLVTRATEPFLHDEHVAAGSHINAVGAITLDRAEFDTALLRRCDLVVCDSVSQARVLARVP